MSKISDGIEFALQQARAERSKTASSVAESPAEPMATNSMGLQLKQAAQVFLADDEEDVTVGDLKALMREFQ